MAISRQSPNGRGLRILAWACNDYPTAATVQKLTKEVQDEVKHDCQIKLEVKYPANSGKKIQRAVPISALTTGKKTIMAPSDEL